MNCSTSTLHAVAHGAQSRAQRRSGLALAGAGVDQDQSAPGWWLQIHRFLQVVVHNLKVNSFVVHCRLTLRTTHWNYALTPSSASVIRMSRENCTGPVELLCHDQASELVSQRHRPKREQATAAFALCDAESDHPSAGPIAKTMCCTPSSRRCLIHSANASEDIVLPRPCSIMTAASVLPRCRPSHSRKAGSLRKASVAQRMTGAHRLR